MQQQADFIPEFATLSAKLSEVTKDKTVADFMRENLAGKQYQDLRFAVKNYVEGYYAGNTTKASTLAFREEILKEEEDQFHINEGYSLLVEYLENDCRLKGVSIYLSSPVKQIHWKEGEANVLTENGSFMGQKVLITVPLGVLQKDSILFYPALPNVKKAAQSLGFGHVIKIILAFKDCFWQKLTPAASADLSDAAFLFSEEKIPTWWTHYPRNIPLLTGWLGGPKAEASRSLTREEVINVALKSLSSILSMNRGRLEETLTGAYYYNWSDDPYSEGAYAYEVVGGNNAIKTLLEPIATTLYFAGEGLHQGKEMGTVEAALSSGKESAGRLLVSF